MFSDIRSFTTLSEILTSEENFRFINSYLSHMGPLISKHGGFIDKYIGDAIMALFNEADEALSAAIDMIHGLIEYNAGRVFAGYIPIEIGIGINTGSLILGTVGESDRMQTTVIGDSVNLAARTEGLTKIYQTPVLITEHTFKRLKNPQQFNIRLLDCVQVKGKNEVITIYEALDPLPDELKEKKISIKHSFEKAFTLFRKEDFIGAHNLFKECLDQCPEDAATRIYLERCQKYLYDDPVFI